MPYHTIPHHTTPHTMSHAVFPCSRLTVPFTSSQRLASVMTFIVLLHFFPRGIRPLESSWSLSCDLGLEFWRWVNTSREVHEARLPRTCSRPCALEVKKTKKKNEIPPDTKKTHHEIYQQQPGDRDHLETACSETRPTR